MGVNTFLHIPIILAFSGLRFVGAASTSRDMETPSHRELIDAIGRDTVKTRYDLSRQRLHNWRKRGIPHSHRVAVAKLAAEHGVVVPANFFEGMAS